MRPESDHSRTVTPAFGGGLVDGAIPIPYKKGVYAARRGPSARSMAAARGFDIQRLFTIP